MKKIPLPGMILLAIHLMCVTMPVLAGDTGTFDFYYQRIEKVVQVAPTEPPASLWGKVGAFIRDAGNTVARVFEKTVRRNLFPGEGSTRWYSEQDHGLAYQMKRVKVRNERHLLALMGAADGNEEALNDGQRALLTLYRNSQNQALKDLSAKAPSPRIVVHLTDTTGFEDSKLFPHVTKDFWPESMFLSITMPSKRYAYAHSGEDALSTFVHETGHCTNITIPELVKPYGPDGTHYADEMIKERMAFQEGWSDYQEALFSDSERAYYERCAKRIRIEDPKVAGKYAYFDATDPRIKGLDLFHVEAVNAMTLYRLSQDLPNGREKINAAFFSRNLPWRDMEGLLTRLAATNPADAATIAKVIDDMTVGKLSRSELQALIGDSPAARAYLDARPTGTGRTTPVQAQTPLEQRANPALPAAQEAFQAAYRAFVDVSRSGNPERVKKAQENLRAARERLEGLK